MNRPWIVSLLLVGLLGVGAAAAPRIVVDSPVYTATVPVGSLVSHSFTITNAGTGTLSITNIQVGCSCTGASMAVRDLAAGKSAVLVATVDTKGYSGTVRKEVYVYSNDPATPMVTLTLSLVLMTQQPYQIAANELYQAFSLLIDLRTPQEYATSHLAGALNIPYAELATWTSRLPKEATIILYDQTGASSDVAAQTLRGLGFNEAVSLFGGLDEWTREYQKQFVYPF